MGGKLTRSAAVGDCCWCASLPVESGESHRRSSRPHCSFTKYGGARAGRRDDLSVGFTGRFASSAAAPRRRYDLDVRVLQDSAVIVWFAHSQSNS
jgi:hypothetical protein